MICEMDKCGEDEYKELCKEMTAILQLKKEVAHREKAIKPLLIEKAGGNRLEYGIKVTRIECRGTVDYSRIVTEWEIDEATLEEYRKPTYEKWDVRNY